MTIQAIVNFFLGLCVLLLCAQVGLLHKRLSSVFLALEATSKFIESQRTLNELNTKWCVAQAGVNAGNLELVEQIRRAVVDAKNVTEIPRA